MSDSYRTKCLRGSIVEASTIVLALANNGELFIGITTGVKPLIVETTEFCSSGEAIFGLHKDEPFTGGSALSLVNLDGTKADGLADAVIKGSITPTNAPLDPLVARYKAIAFGSGKRNPELGGAPITLDANTNYVLQAKNVGGGPSDVSMNASFSEVR